MLEKHVKLVALFGVVGGLLVGGCGEKEVAVKETTGTTDTAGTTGTTAPAVSGGGEVVAPPVAKASPEARAKVLGYAQYLPKDTEALLAFYDGKGFLDSIRGSKFGTFLEARAAEEGVNLDQALEDPQAAMVLKLLSEELLFGFGKGTAVQTDALVRLGDSSNFHQMKMLVKMLDGQVGGEEAPMGPPEMMGMVQALLQDPEAGVTLLEGAQMPPLTVALKVSDEALREEFSGMATGGLAELLAEIGPDGEGFAEAVEVERGGTKFTGVRIIGEKVMAMLGESDKEGMNEMLGEATVERLLKVGATKNLVVATGVHHGYVVFFVGTDIGELQVAASAGESFAASDDVAFVDGFVDKKLLMVSAVSQTLASGVTKNATVLANVAAGLKAGLGEADNLGDTRDIEVLLDLLVKQEKELMGMVKYTATGVAVVREDGLKVEVFGGNDGAAMELNTPRRYAALGDREGVFLFANGVANKAYSAKALEYLDTLGELAYLSASHASKLEIDAPDFKEFQEGFGMFDEKMRADLLMLWTALRGDLAAGLGEESALIVDMKGGLPTVPGIPQVIADEGKAPRIGLVMPVADRAKISDSWKGINTAAENILKTVSELAGENIPMQKPMSSEKDDLKTWFFATIPFQTDDFVLSVSVDEENFFASTSKSFVQELSTSLKGAKPDPSKVGAYMKMDFAVLRAYLEEWVALVDKNAEELFGGPDAAEGMRGELPKVREAITALSDLDSLTSWTRMESGKLRMTLHFKVK